MEKSQKAILGNTSGSTFVVEPSLLLDKNFHTFPLYSVYASRLQSVVVLVLVYSPPLPTPPFDTCSYRLERK